LVITFILSSSTETTKMSGHFESIPCNPWQLAGQTLISTGIPTATLGPSWPFHDEGPVCQRSLTP
jgi:hypothetical protein